MKPTVYKEYQDAWAGFLQAHCITYYSSWQTESDSKRKKMGQKHSHSCKVSSGRGGEGRRGEERWGDLDRVGGLRAICESWRAAAQLKRTEITARELRSTLLFYSGTLSLQCLGHDVDSCTHRMVQKLRVTVSRLREFSIETHHQVCMLAQILCLRRCLDMSLQLTHGVHQS